MIGQPISVPCRWEASAYLILTGGVKHVHSMTVPCATLVDMIPLMNEQFSALITEHGSEVTGAGWTAHGRGSPKKRSTR